MAGGFLGSTAADPEPSAKRNQIVTIDFGGADETHRLSLQADGKVVTSGIGGVDPHHSVAILLSMARGISNTA